MCIQTFIGRVKMNSYFTCFWEWFYFIFDHFTSKIIVLSDYLSCSYVRVYKHTHIFSCDVSFPANISLCKTLHESSCRSRTQNSQIRLEHRSAEYCHWADQAPGEMQGHVSSFESRSLLSFVMILLWNLLVLFVCFVEILLFK